MRKITKSDIVWSYVAQFFSIASGLLVLPLLLTKLSSEEIGFNYVMLTVGSMVALFDFGFSNQYGRNITYVLSGVQSLKAEGIDECTGKVNKHLLAAMLQVAKFTYKRIALMAFMVMLFIGSFYIYEVTKGFSVVRNSFFIWLLYCVSVFLDLYFLYFQALLIGACKVQEAKKAIIYSRICYLILCYVFLLMGMGLLGCVVANFIAPFINRYYSYKSFYTEDIVELIKDESVNKEECVSLFKILWHNSSRLGINIIGSFVINKSGMFLAGIFLPLAVVGSYGIMIQLFGVVITVASTIIVSQLPQYTCLRAEGKIKDLISSFAGSVILFYIISICGCVFLCFIAPSLLDMLHSKTELPSNGILVFYSLICILEANHSQFANMILTSNDIPFVKSSLLTGICILLFSYLGLNFVGGSIFMLIFSQFVCQLAYNNWRWPYWILKEWKINYFHFLKLGFNEIVNYKKNKNGRTISM